MVSFQILEKAVYRAGPKNLLRPNLMRRLHLFPEEVIHCTSTSTTYSLLLTFIQTDSYKNHIIFTVRIEIAFDKFIVR